MRKAIFLALLIVFLFSVVGCGELPDEIKDVSVGVSEGFRTDSRGRVQHTVTIKNNSDKTLVKGSYSIMSVDISGKMLSSDRVYPENIRPGGHGIADVWLDLSGNASVRGEWRSARFK